MSKILTFTLNPSFDKKVYVVAPEPEVYQIQWEEMIAAGKGVNVSRALTRLKVPNIASGVLALDFKVFQQKLRLEGIKHDFIHINHGSVRVNTTVVQDKKVIKRIIGNGPKLTKSDLEQIKKGFLLRIKNAGYVVLSGRNAEGLPAGFYRELSDLASQKDVKVALDTRDDALKQALKSRPWMIKPNCVEASDILGYKVTTKEQQKKAIKDFHAAGVHNVILSLGKEGVIASNQKETWEVKAPAVNVVDEVGCGDAFIAGFCFADQKGMGFKEALSHAVALASASAESARPAEFTLKRYKELYPNVTAKKL